ncbi:MAG: hypothetical protein P9L94_00600 [Candidatus Hinthialibacter antarcticus]|nr:hypothetical protein [Candidatus Hinthialibacter antarcticus]
MKQTQKIQLVFAICVTAFMTVFVGCETAQTVWMPTHEQLIALGDVSQHVEADSLRRGRILAVTECASCHRQFWPNEYSEREWPSILRKMGKRAFLDQDQVKDLINYHVAASRASLNREEIKTINDKSK